MKLVELFNADGRVLRCEPQDVERFQKLGFASKEDQAKKAKAPAKAKSDDTEAKEEAKTKTTRRTTRKTTKAKVSEDESAGE